MQRSPDISLEIIHVVPLSFLTVSCLRGVQTQTSQEDTDPRPLSPAHCGEGLNYLSNYCNGDSTSKLNTIFMKSTIIPLSHEAPLTLGDMVLNYHKHTLHFILTMSHLKLLETLTKVNPPLKIVPPTISSNCFYRITC